MECAHCRSENLDNARFCNQCGYPLEKAARDDFPSYVFGDNLAKIQRYLPQGLTKKILSQRDRIEGERRLVTVMFCDMEGFTPLVEHLGAESAYSVMGQVYEILIRQVNDYEGTVNEMTGDGIMALFGAPIALEDAPQRALWAARAIHREMAVFNKAKMDSNPIRMRIGVHSGPVVVGTLGNDLRVEFKAVGDTVNLASRMERLAEPGTTCVTREVFKLTRGLFEFENLGRKAIKGRGETIPVYKVLPGHQDIHRPQLGSERLISSDMVGRDGELDRLEQQVVNLINGEGAIVNIIGEAGIGKSRLLAELGQREPIRRVTLLEGRAISMGRNLPFHPVIDLLKQWAEISPEDDEKAVFTKLGSALHQLFPGRTGEVLPFLATLMGMSLPAPHKDRIQGIEGEALEKLIRKNLRELLIRQSEWRPLVIVVDDLHWADSSTIELLEFLFRLVKQARILFINLFRPGYEETGQRVLKMLNENLAIYQVDILLEPLDGGMSEAMITDMLHLREVNHAVVKQIVERAGGNPYFIEEVVRSFVDEGAVVLQDGLFRVTDKLDRMTIPNTINDVLMARIDRLEEDAQDLLKVAAVIGRKFFYRILVEVIGSAQHVDKGLSYLKETQLIIERERFDELEYQFKHALTQEAAYAAILPHKCRALHLKVANAIENVFADKLHGFYGMLAYHYSRAENLEKAEEALIKAGEEALKSSASSEALHYYMEALRLYLQKAGDSIDSAKVALLEKNIALAFFNRGHYEEAIAYFDKALRFYWGRQPENGVLVAFKFLWAFLHVLVALYIPGLKYRKRALPEDIQTFEFYYKKTWALSIINPKKFFIESIYFLREVTRYELSNFDMGVHAYVASSSLFSFTGISFFLSQKILNSARKSVQKNQAKIYIIYDFMDTIHKYLLGDWRKIAGHDIELVDKNLEDGEMYAASQHLYWHGCPSIYKGKMDQARNLLDKLSDLAEIYENDFSILLNYMLKIKLLVECRHLDDAYSEIDAGIAFAKKKGFTITLLDFYSCQARIFMLWNDLDKAERSLQIADVIQSTNNATPIQLSIYYRSKCEFWLVRLEEALNQGDPSAVGQYRKKALKACRLLLKTAKKAAQHRTEALRMRGIYYGLIGKHGRAFKWLDQAVREGERLGARLELSRTYFAVGQRLMASNGRHIHLNGITADEYFEKARALFVEMNLQWDLDTLDRFTHHRGT